MHFFCSWNTTELFCGYQFQYIVFPPKLLCPFIFLYGSFTILVFSVILKILKLYRDWPRKNYTTFCIAFYPSNSLLLFTNLFEIYVPSFKVRFYKDFLEIFKKFQLNQEHSMPFVKISSCCAGYIVSALS